MNAVKPDLVKRRVLVVSGAAPYLGGPETWRGLIEAAPELEFLSLDFIGLPMADVPADVRHMIACRLPSVDAVLAHSTVAKAVLETVAVIRPSLPTILLSPHLLICDSLRARFARKMVRMFSSHLVRVAQVKQRRLLASRRQVEKQLHLLVKSSACSRALLSEACSRIQHPSIAYALTQTDRILLDILTPVSREVLAVIENLLVISGTSPSDRKAARAMQGSLLHNAWSAPMIEAPAEVALRVRQFLLT